MPKQSGEKVEARAKQSAASKRATFDTLLNKKRAEQEVVLVFGDKEISMLFKALSSTEYDKILADSPPTTPQKAEGMIYNENVFGPRLLSQVCVEPQMSEEQWKEVWNSEDWSKGEMTELFIIAGRLCNKGLDIPKSESE